MNSDDALLVAWAETLRRKGDAPGVFDPSGEVLRTFAAIEAEACRLTDALEQFTTGDVVAVQIGNHPTWPALLLACRRRGLVVLPLEQSITDAQRDAATDVCRARTIVRAGDRLEFRLLGKETMPAFAEDPPALLKLTSGTTAAPRAIRFRSEQLLADCEQICDTMGIGETDINFAVIPVSHSYGFSNLLTPLLARGVAMVVSQDRLPRAVIADLARSGATVFPGMPVFFQPFCEMPDLPALPRLRLCISAGAPLSAALAQRFHEKFGQPIHSFYGSSECGGICYDRDGTAFADGYVGAAMKGVTLEPIDSAGSSSQVRVRSAAVGDDYFPEPDRETLGNGTFLPADLLARHGAGFKIVGRVSDLINVAGKKVNPAQVEAELARLPGVREAVVFGRRSAQRNEEVAACVVADTGVEEAVLLRACRERLSSWQVPKRIYLVDELPVNERGKLSRRLLAERFAQQH